jgi:putative ABC transport system permease protein
LIQILDETEGVVDYLPRIESFALSATESKTKGAMVVGIDTEKEKLYSKLHERVSEGEYLGKADEGALIGKGLAEYLELGVGDTIVLFGQGYHGSTAAGKYPIKGIVKFGSPELSKQLVFLSLQEADILYSTEGLVSSLVLKLDDPESSTSIVNEIKGRISNDYEAMDWFELVPDLTQMIEADRVEGYIFMFILYMVISFGMFGTVLMMLAERKHESGVLVAIGMKRKKLALMVWMEVMIISLLGAFFGMLGAFPVCLYFNLKPIQFGEEMAKMMEEYGMEAVLQTSIDPEIFINQAVIVAIIASVIAIYPLVNLLKLNAIKAMRS